jgi:hypothetical protein
MEFEQQKEIYVSVYSIDYLLKCSIIELLDNNLKLSPISGKLDMFQKFDPVVIVGGDIRGIEAIPADVFSIDGGSSQVILNLRFEEVNQERRVFERYPVSLTISARKKYSSRRLHMLVKNISLYGMGAISSVKLDIEDLIDIDLITDRSMFYFNAKVVWKKGLDDEYFEYGLQLTNYDVVTQYQFQEYLKKQTKHYIDLIPKAR